MKEAAEKHVPALDGLRGCAVLLVLYFHASLNAILPRGWRLISGLGWTGVDLFFVLSGYLITNILLNSRESTSYYKSFYARRALRIAPVYYLALIIILLVQPFVSRHLHGYSDPAAPTWGQQIWYWLNISNLRSAFYPLEIPLATIYWSLAIEEQFYSVWPTVVRRFSGRTIGFFCVAGIALSLILRCLPFVQRGNLVYDNLIYRLTPFRLDGLLLGALLAVYLNSHPSSRQIRKVTVVVFVLGMAGILATGRGLYAPLTAAMPPYGYTAIALFYASIISICLAPTTIAHKAFTITLSTPLLRSFGRYSYFIYVFHILILHHLEHFYQRLTLPFSNIVFRTYLFLLIGLIACWLAGAASWKLMEQPILNLKRFIPYRFNKPGPWDPNKTERPDFGGATE